MRFEFPFKGGQRKSPSEVIGLDIATTGVKAVLMKKTKDGLIVTGVAVLPAIALESGDESGKPVLALPKKMLTNYAALAISGEGGSVRILSLQGNPNAGLIDEAQVREQVGLGQDYRMGFAVAVAGKGKQETKLLVVGLPEKEAQSALDLVAVGAPAPCSLELSGLSALAAFLRGAGKAHEQDAVAVIDAGARLTFMALFNKGVLVLVRKFELGSESIVTKVQQQLNVDRDTARGVISDGSFDISQSVRVVMASFLRQLTISKDFIERREDCRVVKCHLSGGTSLLRYWLEEIRNATGVDSELWNPFSGLHMADGAYPADLAGQEPRFAAAVGACLGVLEE
jgi:Tfp pilus assembly PilM family ATPase